MGLFRSILISFVFLFVSLRADIDTRHILYLMQSNEVEKAFTEYQKALNENIADFETLQKMSLILLKKGVSSPDLEIQQLSVLGAGIAASSNSLEILEIGLNSPVMQTQLMSLNFLSMLQDDKIDSLLMKAMSSDFLPTRLEAVYHMAQRKHPYALGQMESLMFRLPPFLKPLFPSLLATLGTTEAKRHLKRFLNDANPDCRIETILSIANNSLDELLPDLRSRLQNSTIAEKEAICFVLSFFKDTSCIQELKKLADNSQENVALAAAKALYTIGDESKKNVIFKLAEVNNNFAIYLLKDISNSEDFLYNLSKSKNKQTKLNATYALLKRKDKRSLEGLKDLFVSKDDLAMEPFFSNGRTMLYFKAVPSAVHRMKDSRFDPSITLSIKESILKDSIELDEESFLKIANHILKNNQTELIPMLISLLENLSTTNAIELIKENSRNGASSLIKDYCNLSLYRLKQEGNYENYIANWIKQKNHEDLIKVTLSNENEKKSSSVYDLTKEESSRLLIDMYTALAAKQDPKSLAIIVESIKKTNPKNRYALLGILIRAAE